MSAHHVAILGAGPAGVGAALHLAERGFEVDLIERGDSVGGNSGSFEVAGIRVDYGSHRLHPASDPEVLALIRETLGDDLLERPRHGRIRLLGRWIHFPLRPVDMALRIHPRFALGVGVDLLRQLVARRSATQQDNFASVLERGLGSTICREFYFPYARKIWGAEPSELSATQAYKRVSAGSIGKMLQRLLPGGGGSGGASTKGIFYYPRRGFGQISESLCQRAQAAGARLHLKHTVTGVRRSDSGGFSIDVTCDGQESRLEADRVWSTIPNAVLARQLNPAAPSQVIAAAQALELRAMLLIYLVLETDQFTEYDAHYFPGADIRFTRLSEPKNYANQGTPKGHTVLCAELPCSQGDDFWQMDDASLGELVTDDLARSGLPITCPIRKVVTRRLPAAYPIYRDGYERHFETVDQWIDSQEALLSFGRQGLFAHDNTHHALFMAQAASACLDDSGHFDQKEWQRYREIFDGHVVED